MKHLILFLLISLLFAACQTADKPILSNYLNAGNLPQQSFTINPNADTTITSGGGIKIKISKGTFPVGKTVTIEWKEALDFQSILKAGLTTQTGKELLRSGGMFYFNTKEELAIQKPIDIDVPTETIASGMQLYKGDSSEGKLDWKDPKPIENVKAFGENVLGKNLFEENCRSCHKVGQDLTAPALANFQYRGPWRNRQNFYDWVHNPTGFMATDYYTQELKCKYGVVQQAFPDLSYEALDSIASYIEEETRRLGIPEPVYADNSKYDSCNYYRSLYDSLLNARNNVQSTNNNSIDIEYNLPPKMPPPSTVTFLNKRSDYYRVKIDATGWYNVDALVEGRDWVVKSKLIVKLKGEGAAHQEIYLAIPAVNIVGQGGYLENRTDIGFDKLDGSIPLPQKTKAFVFAIGEQQGKFYFSRKDFTTSIQQTIILNAEELTKNQFDLKMLQLKESGLPTLTDTTREFSNLKMIDDKLNEIQMKKLKDCGCGGSREDGTSRDSIQYK